MIKSCVADNINTIINRKGIKKYVVAKNAGYDVNTFSAMLNGRRCIRDIDIIAIANALEVEPKDLFATE